VLATHSDEALAVLQTEPEEKSPLAICFQPNSAVLHTDRSFCPPARAWASWNSTARATGRSCHAHY